MAKASTLDHSRVLDADLCGESIAAKPPEKIHGITFAGHGEYGVVAMQGTINRNNGSRFWD